MPSSLFILTLSGFIASSKQSGVIDRLINDFLSSQAFQSNIERQIADTDVFVDLGDSPGIALISSDFLFSTDMMTSVSDVAKALEQIPDDWNSLSSITWNSEYKPAINRALFYLYTDVVIRSLSGHNTEVVKLIEQLHYCFAFFSGGDDSNEILEVKYELLRQLNIINLYLAQGHATYNENLQSQIEHFVDFSHSRLEAIADEVRYARKSVEAAEDLRVNTLWVLFAISRGLISFTPLCDLEPLQQTLQAVEMWHYVSIKSNILFPTRAHILLADIQNLIDRCISSRV